MFKTCHATVVSNGPDMVDDATLDIASVLCPHMRQTAACISVLRGNIKVDHFGEILL